MRERVQRDVRHSHRSPNRMNKETSRTCQARRSSPDIAYRGSESGYPVGGRSRRHGCRTYDSLSPQWLFRRAARRLSPTSPAPRAATGAPPRPPPRPHRSVDRPVPFEIGFTNPSTSVTRSSRCRSRRSSRLRRGGHLLAAWPLSTAVAASRSHGVGDERRSLGRRARGACQPWRRSVRSRVHVDEAWVAAHFVLPRRRRGRIRRRVFRARRLVESSVASDVRHDLPPGRREEPRLDHKQAALEGTTSASRPTTHHRPGGRIPSVSRSDHMAIFAYATLMKGIRLATRTSASVCAWASTSTGRSEGRRDIWARVQGKSSPPDGARSSTWVTLGETADWATLRSSSMSLSTACPLDYGVESVARVQPRSTTTPSLSSIRRSPSPSRCRSRWAGGGRWGSARRLYGHHRCDGEAERLAPRSVEGGDDGRVESLRGGRPHFSPRSTFGGRG